MQNPPLKNTQCPQSFYRITLYLHIYEDKKEKFEFFILFLPL